MYCIKTKPAETGFSPFSGLYWLLVEQTRWVAIEFTMITMSSVQSTRIGKLCHNIRGDDHLLDHGHGGISSVLVLDVQLMLITDTGDDQLLGHFDDAFGETEINPPVLPATVIEVNKWRPAAFRSRSADRLVTDTLNRNGAFLRSFHMCLLSEDVGVEKGAKPRLVRGDVECNPHHPVANGSV